MSPTVHGLQVSDITYAQPGNSLPAEVRQAAAERGYGDAQQPISLYITVADIEAAFECAAHGNGKDCVMAQAGRRLGVDHVYFYRHTAWLDFGDGPIIRYSVGGSIYVNVIEPFDRGERDSVLPGVYHLVPPTPSKRLSAIREQTAKRGKRPRVGTGEALPVRHHAQHSERVVMAARSDG